MPATIRANAAEHSLTINTDTGEQVYDLAHMNKDQLAGVREMVVNWWAVNNGFKAPYPHAAGN